MGRMKEEVERDRQHQTDLKWARAEAAHDALPQSLSESHEMIRSLQEQVLVIVRQMNAAGPKWKERLYGFGFGVIASLVATAVWPKLAKILPFLQ